MDIGQVVDYVEEYNRIHNVNTKTSTKPAKEEVKTRKATQADWDWMLG